MVYVEGINKDGKQDKKAKFVFSDVAEAYLSIAEYGSRFKTIAFFNFYAIDDDILNEDTYKFIFSKKNA